MSKRLGRRSFIAATSALAAPAIAHGQTALPDRALRIVVGFPTGGGSDLVARAIAPTLERRTGQIVTVLADETIPDSLIVSGNTVNMDGTVEGDLILFCRQGTVRGKVQGNIVSFSRNLQIEGEVGGSAFTFGQWVTLRGQTARNLFAFAQNLSEKLQKEKILLVSLFARDCPRSPARRLR